MTDDLAAKAVDTDWGILRLGNEVFPMAGATFVRNETTPDVRDSNHVSDITARTLQEIEVLFATAEREYAFANHRRFEVDHRTPPEFVARLQVEEGFTTDGAIILLLEGELKGTAKERDIRPVNSDADWEAFWELHLLNWNTHSDAAARGGDAVARQMWQSKRDQESASAVVVGLRG